MRLTVTQFMTLDGVVQGPGAPEEDTSDGFDLGGWLPPHFDEAVGAYMTGIFEVADEFLLGRRTYDLMAAYWPEQPAAEDETAIKLNELPKHIATSRTDELAWQGSARIEGDVAAAVTELKRRPGRELQVHGSGTLVRSLAAADLVDAYHLLLFPVVLGRGRRLFGDGMVPAGLRLTDHRTSGSGVALLTYETVGWPVLGSVLDEPPT